MHLAQLNIARLRHPLDHRESQDFADGLVPINLLAESSPGFVWRLQTDEGDATSLRPHPDPNLIVNLSVWRSMDELRDFSYRSAHSLFLRRRAEWFHPMTNASAVAWWIDEGREPSVDEAFDRMQFLRTHGPSPWAFGVTRPGAQLAIKRVVLDDGDAMSLIDELNAELSEMYPEPGSTFFRLDPDQVTGTNGAFLLATLDGVAVACGAFRVLGDQLNSAEIKRMFVRPSGRGMKLGAAVLVELERVAAGFGVTRMVLETGSRQEAAMQMYTRGGYLPCPCWGAYAASGLSCCYEKTLVRQPLEVS